MHAHARATHAPGHRLQQSHYAMVSTSYLYDKAMDSGAGVHTFLQEAAVQQSWAESVLAYARLARAGIQVRWCGGRKN